jgi:hypothetical protein
MRQLLVLVLGCAALLACGGAKTQPTTADSSTSPAPSSEGTASAAVPPSSPSDRDAAPPEPTQSTPATPTPPPPITSVWLELTNNCPTAVDYCVDDGSTLYTFLSPNASTTHSVRPGAKIRYRKSNNCTDTVFTVTADSEKQKANLCK